METDDVIIKNSNIHNKGVFAKRNFKKGDIVLRWDTSHTLTKEETSTLTETEKSMSLLDGKYIIMQKPEKYVNHSCDANTSAQNFCDIAIKNIAKGEEITANYTEEFIPGTTMECHCGSKNCKKIIEK